MVWPLLYLTAKKNLYDGPGAQKMADGLSTAPNVVATPCSTYQDHSARELSDSVHTDCLLNPRANWCLWVEHLIKGGALALTRTPIFARD